MGSYLNKILDSFSSMKAKIVMIGLDGAGKTTVLYQMKLNQNVSSVPTIGFNVETIKYKNLEFTVWDIGGQTKFRSLWHHYYDNNDAIIYVVDSSDEERLELAKQTLEAIMSNQNLSNSPVLILANKMDLARLKPSQIVEKLGLHTVRGKTWNLQPCCATNGDGIAQGFEWLRTAVKGKKK